MQVSNKKIAQQRELTTRRETSMPTTGQLEVIAKAMVAGTVLEAPDLHAGYTYLGQFISHDIVRVTNPLPAPAPPPHAASAFLDLDSVYGATPDEAPRLVADKFVIAPSVAGGPDDLQRKDGIAQIPDSRNDDNVIISQLHLFLQRFHNFTIDRGFAANAAHARRLVTLAFQLVVVEDYLRQILAPAVFDSYFRYDRRWLGLERTKVPQVFSHAAFRFGHSMVRPTYQGFPHNASRDVALFDLFQGGHNLERNLAIDWHRFFGWPGIRDATTTDLAQKSSRIDHVIAESMRKIRTPHGDIDIVSKNLLAGVTARLPNGTSYVDELLTGNNGKAMQAALALAPLHDLHDATAFVNAGVGVGELPLWPYILVEAWHASRGQHLGVLGSMICAEVLANAIAGAKHSIYRDRWASTDEVLTSLQGLGEALQDVRRSAAAQSSRPFADRTFCMRHLIDLVLGANPTT